MVREYNEHREAGEENEVRSQDVPGESTTENVEEQGIVQCLLQSFCTAWAVPHGGFLR